MHKLSLLLASGFLLAGTGIASAQIDFSQRTITHFATPAEIQTLAGKTTTSANFLRTDGAGNLFNIHDPGTTGNFEETLLRFPTAGPATAGVVVAEHAALIGPAADADLRVSGIAISGNTLVIGDSFTAEILKIDLATDPVTVTSVAQTAAWNGGNGIAPASATQFVGVTASDFGGGNGATLLIDTAGNSVGELFPASAITGVTSQANVSIRGFDIAPDGTLWGFENVSRSMVRITNVLDPSRTVSVVAFPNVTATSSIRNVAVVDNYLILGDNQAADARFRVYDITVPTAPTEVASFAYADISAAIAGTTFGEPQFHNGLALSKPSATQVDMFLAARNSTGLGIVQVTFGNPPSNVDNWNLY